ncbi:uncharacterized protein C11orf16 homolog [Struthio camelus]|uniref:uncharacterized protein C11orf16 homolog n=1 Tax=Struthio camelus TaxID=8801 RepID=UPI00360400C7
MIWVHLSKFQSGCFAFFLFTANTQLIKVVESLGALESICLCWKMLMCCPCSQVPIDHDLVLQVAAPAGMARSKGFLPTNHKYCSAMTALDKFSCYGVISTVNPCCRNSLAVHPPWITMPLTPWRCQWISCCPLSPDAVWKKLSVSERLAGLARNAPVLVRGEHDGFYYRGTVKEELESERGMFLIEFAKPLVAHGKCPVCVQKTIKDDILEYVNGMKHSLLPGDKVLAPWEPDMVRYGPGTVLTGIETRDPSRASEDEEIMVHFWNGKKVKVPLDSLAKHGLLCWPRFHCHCDGICCSSIHARSICCCHLHTDAWWPLPARSPVLQREMEEAEPSSKPSSCLLDLKGLKQEGAAAAAASSPSSDSERDLEAFATKSTMTDSAVNTDSSLLGKPKVKESARPKWKYWKRSHHKSHPSNSGISPHSSSYTKGQLESKATSVVDRSCVTPANQSAMFEIIEQPPRGQLTVKEILTYQDFKPSSTVG